MRYLLLILAAASLGMAETSVCGTEELLPIGFTEEELQRLDEIGMYSPAATDPPPSGTRNPGEFEPATGVMFRWPLGIPYDLIVDFSNEGMVWVICESYQQGDVESAFISAGVNMDNVDYILAPTNSIWVRDYGPWFIALPDGDIAIFDYVYNRPRPDDDQIPWEIGDQWGLEVYASDIEHTGGNYMSAGFDQSMSTDMVYEENPQGEDWVDSQMELYLGVTDYVTMEDPQGSYIDHIDCWAKMLSPDRLMVLEVPPGHPDYTALESAAEMLEQTTSPYGTDWQVFRVYSGGTEGYTNSLISEDRVYMPTWNTSNDYPAIMAYEEALPGYQVDGYYYSGFSNTDALHCRTRNAMDVEMLTVWHVPVDSVQPASQPVEIEALMRPHPDNSLASHLLHYRTGTSGPFSEVDMSAAGDDMYTAQVPAQTAGTTVQYYVTASDDSGRDEESPRFAPDTWFHEYQTSMTGVADQTRLAPGAWITDPTPNPFAGSVALTLALEEAGRAEAAVYDLSGRMVARLASGEMQAGAHRLRWTPESSVPSGVYVVRVSAAGSTATRRVTLLH
ncbi:MAG: agmatine deiminase family protein [Candidatus Fermentibacteraceae bacterium]